MSHIFIYVTDKRGLSLALNSAMSVALSQRNNCRIRIFCHEFDASQFIEMIDRFARVGADLTFEGISAPEVEGHLTVGHVTKPSLLKLHAVARSLEDCEVVVYLDNDILVFGDLAIESIEFSGKPLAAVADMDLSDTGVFRKVSTDPSKPFKQMVDYFNAGVMIFNRAVWDRGRFIDAYSRALDEHDVHCRYKISCTSIEQCALNVTFDAAWKSLPFDYNMQASAKFTRFWKPAMVRHYCGTRKFLPISPLRNDSRDIRCIKAIEAALGHPPTKNSPLLFELLYRMNVLRNYRKTSGIKQFLAAKT